MLKTYLDIQSRQQTSSLTPTLNKHKNSDTNSNQSFDDTSNQNVSISENQSSSLSASTAIAPPNLNVESFLFPSRYFQLHTDQKAVPVSPSPQKKPMNLISRTPPANPQHENEQLSSQQHAVFLTQQQHSRYRQTHFVSRYKPDTRCAEEFVMEQTKEKEVDKDKNNWKEQDNPHSSPPPNQILMSAKKAMSTYRARNLDAAMIASARKICKNKLSNTMRNKTRQCMIGINGNSNHRGETVVARKEDKRSSKLSMSPLFGWKSREPGKEQINEAASRSKSIEISMLSHLLDVQDTGNNQVTDNLDVHHNNNRHHVDAAEHEQDHGDECNKDEKYKELKADIVRLAVEIEHKNLVINEYEIKLNAKCRELRDKAEEFKSKQEELEKSSQEMKSNNESLQNQLFALQSKMMEKKCEYESKCRDFISELSKKDNEIKRRHSEKVALENKMQTLQAKSEFLKNRVSKIGKIDLCKSQLMRLKDDYRKFKAAVEFELKRKKQDFVFVASTISTALKYGHENVSHYHLLMEDQEEHSPRTQQRQQQQTEAANEEFRKQTDLETIKTERDELKSNLVKLTMTYRKEKKLRKQLLEQIIDLKGNIRVFCRVRPKIRRKVTEKHNNDQNTTVGDTTTHELMATTCLDDERVVINDESKKYFSFDQVYPPEASQETIFEDVKPLIHSAVDGYNVCIFAYGQTGSGKTYTMEGTQQHPGIIYESFDELFKLKAIANNLQTSGGPATKANEMQMKVYLSCLEIYNEKIRDLLVDINKSNNQNSKINPRDLKAKLSKCSKRVLVPGLTNLEVSNTENIRDILRNVAYKNRSTGVTNMNEHSSRSHALVFVDIVTKQSSSRLVLIDLAGSERVKKTCVSGTAFDEARSINKSLSALGNVISALQSKQKHIPFRDSQLTYLLYDCLGGNSRALMFCNISCEVFDIKESLNTLTFAHRVRRVQLGEAQKNENANGESREKENKEMHDKLEMFKQKLKKYKKELEDKEKDIKELKVSTRTYKKEISKLTSSIGVQNNKNMNHQQTRMEYNNLQKEHWRLSQVMDKKERVIKKLQGEVNDYKHKWSQMVKHKNQHNNSNPQILRVRTTASSPNTSGFTATQQRTRHAKKRKQPSNEDTDNNSEDTNNEQHMSMKAPAQKRQKIKMNHHTNTINNMALGRNGRGPRLKSHSKLLSKLQPTKIWKGRQKNGYNVSTVLKPTRGQSVSSAESNPKAGSSQHQNMVNANAKLKCKKRSSLRFILNSHDKPFLQQEPQTQEINPKQVNKETTATTKPSHETMAPLTPHSAMLLVAAQPQQENEGNDNEQEIELCANNKNTKHKCNTIKNGRKPQKRNKPITLSSLKVQ